MPTAQNQETATTQGNTTASSFVRSQSSPDQITGIAVNQFGGYSPVTSSGQIIPMSVDPNTYLRSGSGSGTLQSIPTYQTQMPTPTNQTNKLVQIYSTYRKVASFSPINIASNFLRRIF